MSVFFGEKPCHVTCASSSSRLKRRSRNNGVDLAQKEIQQGSRPREVLVFRRRGVWGVQSDSGEKQQQQQSWFRNSASDDNFKCVWRQRTTTAVAEAEQKSVSRSVQILAIGLNWRFSNKWSSRDFQTAKGRRRPRKKGLPKHKQLNKTKFVPVLIEAKPADTTRKKTDRSIECLGKKAVSSERASWEWWKQVRERKRVKSCTAHVA